MCAIVCAPSPNAPMTSRLAGEFGILEAYERALRSAQHLIYLENQFLWSSEIAQIPEGAGSVNPLLTSGLLALGLRAGSAG